MYDAEAARARFLGLGCAPEDADDLVRAGIDPDIVGACAPGAGAFARAAVQHDLADPNAYLRITGGDPERAWQEWAKDSVEGMNGEADDEDGEDEDEDDGAKAYIDRVGPDEMSIDLFDDQGGCGDSNHKTWRFSTRRASDWDGVVHAATEELAAHGYVPVSEFSGGCDNDTIKVTVAADYLAARWWLEQLPAKGHLDRMLYKLGHLHRSDPSTSCVLTECDDAFVNIVPDPASEQPDAASGEADEDSIVDWEDAEDFLQAVADRRPATVYVERHRGDFLERMRGWEELEDNVAGLEAVRVEAARRERELSGFTAAFQDGDSVHRYVMKADWAEELENRLATLDRRVAVAREEGARYPRLQEWGEQLRKALTTDEQFIASRSVLEGNERIAELALTMFGPDFPMESEYIQQTLTTAATRTGIITTAHQAHFRATVLAAIPAWAAQLAARPDFRTGTIAEQSMLASNLLYAYNPAADAGEFVRLLRRTAAEQAHPDGDRPQDTA